MVPPRDMAVHEADIRAVVVAAGEEMLELSVINMRSLGFLTLAILP